MWWRWWRCTLVSRAVTACYYSMPGALGRIVGFEIRCQWVLLGVQITRLYPIINLHLLYRDTFIILSVKCYRSVRVSVIHRTPTWTTGFVTCVRHHSYACLYTRGLVTPTAASQNNIFDSEKLTCLCVCSWRGSNWAHWGDRISSPTLYELRHPGIVYAFLGLNELCIFRKWLLDENCMYFKLLTSQTFASQTLVELLCCSCFRDTKS